MTEVWRPGVFYGAGSKVIYNGIVYRLVQPHTSQSDWIPGVAHSLWTAEGPESQNQGSVYGAHTQYDHQYSAPQIPPVQAAPYAPPNQYVATENPQQPWQIKPDQHNSISTQPATGYQPPGGLNQPVQEPEKKPDYSGEQHQWQIKPEQINPPSAPPAQSNEPTQEPEKKPGYSTGSIVAGILGGAFALGAVGVGAYAVSQHLKKKNDRREWEEEALKGTQKADTPVYWVLTKNAEIPENAIVGGIETNGNKYYISRFWHDHGLYLGKVDPVNVRGAAFGLDGSEHYLAEYEILVGDANAVKWVDVCGSVETAIYERGLKRVEGGHSRDGKEIYVVQAEFDGNWVPGYALDGNAHCGYGGLEKIRGDFKMLVYV